MRRANSQIGVPLALTMAITCSLLVNAIHANQEIMYIYNKAAEKRYERSEGKYIQ